MEWIEILTRFKEQSQWCETKSLTKIHNETIEAILKKLSEDEAKSKTDCEKGGHFRRWNSWELSINPNEWKCDHCDAIIRRIE